MKQFLVILAIIGAAYAGSKTLSALESADELRKFRELCESGRVPEQGIPYNGGQLYCKAKPGRQSEVIDKTIQINVGQGPDQTVYVQPPARDLIHKITVEATGKGGKTKVLVVPGKVDNKYEYTVTEKIIVDKPAITYLQDAQ